MSDTLESGRHQAAIGHRPKILVADDEPALLRNISAHLRATGYDVLTATDGQEAARLIATGTFDAVLSDVSMPGLTGIELLRVVRAHDLDVPVILMTGSPELKTAAEAVEFGAMRYLTKPVELSTIANVAGQAVRLRRLAAAKRQALDLLNNGGLGLTGRAGLEVAFGRALDALWIAYQPIVNAKNGSVFGYEALMRTDEPALPNPAALLDAAERLGRLHELGSCVRSLAIVSMFDEPERGLLFLNLHTRDLLDETLASPRSPLAGMAKRVVLEITERASLDEVKDVASRVANLRAMGFRIAVDDLGAGYAGLTSFAALEPEFVKLDMSLVRDIDKSSTKEKLVRTMAGLCKDMGVLVVGEGVETKAERDVLEGLGCDLLQGYFFARPGRAFPSYAG